MTIPTFEQLMLPVLQKMSTGNPYSRNKMFLELKNETQKTYKMTESEINQTMSSGGNALEYRMSWTFTFLTKAEFIEKSTTQKFHYVITELGKQCLDDINKNKLQLNEKYLKQNSQNYIINWNKKTKHITESNQDEEEINEEIDIKERISELNSIIEVNLINKLRIMKWQEFEFFCANLLEKMGYGVAEERICHIKDGGIDGIIYTDELRIKDKIYIQAKRYNDGNNVSLKDVKEFLYNVKEAKCRGVFITTSKFSKEAELEIKKAIENGTQIAFINDKNLIKLCLKYEHGVIVQEKVNIYTLDENIFY